MSNPVTRFFGEAGRGWLAPLLILTAFVLLVVGIFSPMVSLDKIFSSTKPYSAVSGILDFFQSGHFGLGLLILCFSILFPTGKLGTLALIWFRQPYRKQSRSIYRWLEILGRWSMLDFFVVCILLGAVQLGILAKARSYHGVYVFGAAILLSVIATAYIRHVETDPDPNDTSEWHGVHFYVPLVALGGLLLLYRGVTLPIMKLEKFFFWEHHYSILAGIRQLLAKDKNVLAVAILLFVVLLPGLKLLGVMVAYLVDRLAGAKAAVLRGLVLADALAMIDVFGLALVVVLLRVADLADVTPEKGIWYLGASSLVSIYISWEIQHGYRP